MEPTKIKINDRITPNEFEGKNICSLVITSKDVDSNGSKIKVYDVDYSLNYPYEDENGSKKNFISETKVQFPKVHSKKGIVTKQKLGNDGNPLTYKDGKPKIASKIGVRMDMSRQDIVDCCDLGSDERTPGFLERLKIALSEKLFEVKGQLGSEFAQKKSAGAIAEAFKPYIYFKTNAHGMIEDGTNPDFYFNLKAWGAPGSPEGSETPFFMAKKDSNGKFKKIPWAALHNSSIDFEPLVTFNKLTIVNGAIYLKYVTESAIVEDFVRLSDESFQNDLLEERAMNYSAKADTLENKVDEFMSVFAHASISQVTPPIAQAEIVEKGDVTELKPSRETKMGLPKAKKEDIVSSSEDEDDSKHSQKKGGKGSVRSKSPEPSEDEEERANREEEERRARKLAEKKKRREREEA